jgi:hypothetical protein
MFDEIEDDYYEDEPVQVSAFDADGKLRILTEKCDTCIFRPGNPMNLRPDRVQDAVQGSLAGGGYISCHDTLPYGANPEYGAAVCRGFYDSFGAQSQMIRIAKRLGGVVAVPPPAKEEGL